ncbi:hypothetical protein [Trebonia sp.]|uniref:hypothetical protein n=1 Tax=Trebonia sp. TaxID=2767075 RepID=UPI00260B806D|nr:hypothetical protein [Trebonia sp.]
MTYADPGERARFIAGLLGLAIFLEANPDVPAPLYTDVLVFPAAGTDAERCAEIDAIAARIGAESQTVCGHYIAARYFGPVQYRAVAIPHDNDRNPDGE